jgi:hypothetical protein
MTRKASCQFSWRGSIPLMCGQCPDALRFGLQELPLLVMARPLA